MNIPKNGINLSNVSFSGHNKKLDKLGFESHKFYYMYDPSRYDCELEIYNISKDDKNNVVLNEKAAEFPMKGVPFVEPDLSEVNELNSDLGFAYRFKLTDKNSGEVSYAFDNGQVIGIFDKTAGNQYNVVLNNRAVINNNGPMQLIMPDEYYPGVTRGVDGSLNVAKELRAQQRKAVRTHANKLGGQFVGITKRLQNGDFRNEGIKRIVGTPFTKDTISSHLYWTENAYQVSPNLGNENDFREMQEELFKNGINWIADAALVNEGFGGIHMSELLRKGDDSVSKNMFRLEGEKISLGILPNDFAKKGHTRLKIINAPFSLSQDGKSYSDSNPDYEPDKPTYIQFYDDRLASEEQKKSKSPSRLTTYDKKNVDGNMYAITKHDDAVYPFPIEVSPDELRRNVKNVLSSSGEVNLADADTILQLSDFSTFKVGDKSSAGGLEFWDGNVDIAKLNFFRSVKDDTRFYKLEPEQRRKAIENFERGTYAVREYAVNSGKYWTQLTADTQFEYASRYLSGKGAQSAEDYLKIIQEGAKVRTVGGKKTSDLPPVAADKDLIDEEVIQNALDGDYNLRRIYEADMRADINPELDGAEYSLPDYILRKAMDVPLETLPVATNLLGIITSPYIAKKPNSEDEIGVSRYDLHKANNPNLPYEYAHVYNQTEKMYAEKIVPAIQEIVSGIDGITNEDGTVSDYGRYVISEVVPDLVKYIFVRALDKDVQIPSDKKGVMDFSKVPSEDITMQSLGIRYNGMTSEQEAQIVIDSLNKGIDELKEDGVYSSLKDVVNKRIDGRTLNDYKVAEMLTDRTESGLGWRIDAAKDVASIDAVRSEYDDMETAWDNVINVWKLFNQSVLNINPHAYTTAELTDLADLFPPNPNGKYQKDGDAERKFIQETGITSVANYNYFFSLLPQLFSTANFEDGMPNWPAINGQNSELIQKFDTGWDYGDIPNNPGFLFQSPEDGVVNSYTFVGNHDKPRALHCLSLDMNLFHFGYLTDTQERNLKRKLAVETDGGKKYNMEQKLNFNALNKVKTAEFFGKNAENFDFTDCSSQAVAMGIKIKEAIDSVDADASIKDALTDAVRDLARGRYKNHIFDASEFGTRSFEHAIQSVFDQAEFKNAKIEDREKLEADMLKTMLEPAFEKYLSIYKTLMLLPGSPTDFAGDRVGATGYETKAKNYHQQNRNIIQWENLENPLYGFIKEYYDKLNSIADLRSRPELSALNNGATVTMNVSTGDLSQKVQSILRYNDNSAVLCFFNNDCYAPARENDSDPLVLHGKMQRKETVISDDNNKLYFSEGKDMLKRGLKHGISEGTRFKNPLDTGDEVYTVKRDNEGYYLEKSVNGVVKPISIDTKDLNALVLYKE